MGISKGRIWLTPFNYLKFQGYLQNTGQSPIKAKQFEEKDIAEWLWNGKLHPLLSSKHIRLQSDQRGYWFRQGRGNIYLSTCTYDLSDPPNSLQAQQSFTMGEESWSFQPSKSHEAADSVFQSVHFGSMGMSRSMLEPEPSVLGQVDPSELLKSFLMCSSPSCHCSHLFKTPCAWDLGRNFSPNFLTSNKKQAHSSAESTRTIYASCHTRHVSPTAPTCWSQPGCVNSRGGWEGV